MQIEFKPSIYVNIMMYTLRSQIHHSQIWQLPKSGTSETTGAICNPRHFNFYVMPDH